MSTALITMTLSLALGQAPYGYGGADPSYTIMPTAGPVGGVVTTGGVGGGNFGGGMGGPTANREQLFPFDVYETWAHGYFQDIPAYGGYHNFRPYNYKHVLSQSQVAAGWGMTPNMPYSHEYFRRREQASLDRRRASLEDDTYRTEMARLRAQRDFSQSVSESGQRTMNGPYSPGVNEVSRPVDQAGYVPARGPQTDELQFRIRQQELQLQALQDEYNRTAASYPTSGPGSGGR